MVLVDLLPERVQEEGAVLVNPAVTRDDPDQEVAVASFQLVADILDSSLEKLLAEL